MQPQKQLVEKYHHPLLRVILCKLKQVLKDKPHLHKCQTKKTGYMDLDI
jgi:hypothetical protein